MRGPGPIGGGAIAARIAYYIGQYGQPCTLFVLQKPVPTATTFTKDPRPLTVMIQYGRAAQDMAASIGVFDAQVAAGYVAEADAGRVHDRDVLKDDKGNFFTVRALPNNQAMGDGGGGTSLLASQFALVRTVSPPQGVS